MILSVTSQMASHYSSRSNMIKLPLKFGVISMENKMAFCFTTKVMINNPIN